VREYFGARARVRSILHRLLYEPPDPRIVMGPHSYGHPRLLSYGDSKARVEVGGFCSIASGVQFLVDGEHPTDFITTSPLPGLSSPSSEHQGPCRRPIVVGHDVWIGRDATVLSGVTIGTGAVIGACAVVASDVRPYAIAVGNPAREVRRRFADEDVDALLATEWWTWPDSKIQAAIPLLWSPDVDAFLTHAKRQ